MDELTVRYDGRLLEVPTQQTLGFGRTNLEPGGSAGWGYDGRFIELAPGDHIHRIWGDVIWRRGHWCVRSLGSRHPVSVRLPVGAPIELPPLTPDSPSGPETLAIGHERFDIILAVGAFRFVLECASEHGDEGMGPAASAGRATSSLGEELLRTISENEFRVLYVMAAEFVDHARMSGARLTDGAEPRPLSYSRIQRRLGLRTERQATAAVERLVRRFRDGLLLPDGLPPEQQRAWVCRQAINQGVLDALVDRYGSPDAQPS